MQDPRSSSSSSSSSAASGATPFPSSAGMPPTEHHPVMSTHPLDGGRDVGLDGRSPQPHLPQGLAAQARIMSWMNPINGVFVTVYKVAGFVMLGTIVLAMAGYLATSAFYALSRAWVVPEILGPEHDRVRSESMRYLEQKYQLSKLEMERDSIQSQIEYLDQAIASKSSLEQAMVVALQESKDRRAKLTSKLAQRLNSLESSTPGTLKSFDALLQAELQAIQAAGDSQLLGRSEIMERKNALSQLELSSIDRIRKIAELRQLVPSVGPSLEALRENRELIDLQLEKTQLTARRRPLAETAQSLDALIRSYEASVAALAESPFVLGARSSATVALVPYDNLRGVQKGSKIYGCFLGFVLCQKIGQVERLVPGEVTGVQPFSGRSFRGQYVEITFSKAEDHIWAQRESLMVGSKPLFL